MKLKDIKLPKYRLKHELWNSITHGLGAIFGIIVLILLMCRVFLEGYKGEDNLSLILRIVSIIIYSFSLIICYTISCLYHALARNKAKKVFRIIDHDTVFLLIAGTYTPFCLITLNQYPYLFNNYIYGIGYILLSIVWVLVAIGITLNSINLYKFNILSMILYIVIGWIIIPFVYDLFNESALGYNGVMLLLFGGISYTIGSILYGIGSKRSIWWHTIFHCFTLIGSILQFISIYLYVLN